MNETEMLDAVLDVLGIPLSTLHGKTLEIHLSDSKVVLDGETIPLDGYSFIPNEVKAQMVAVSSRKEYAGAMTLHWECHKGYKHSFSCGTM